MNELISKIKSATKKRFLFGEKLVYSSGKANSSIAIQECERKYEFKFPEEIKMFLLELGAGSTEDFCIFHADQIYPFDQHNGPIENYITLATDTLGNYYAFNPRSNAPSEIYYCCHDPLGYAKIAPNIGSFLQLFIDSEFRNLEVTENLELIEYE